MRSAVGDVAEVRMGYHFRGRVQEEPGGNALVLQIRDVDEEGRFDPGALTAAEIPNLRNHSLSAGDVVFLARGVRRYAFRFEENRHTNIVPAGYFMVLRVTEERLRPGYLAWAINQNPFQAQVDAASSGTAVPQITKANLTRLTIDVPDSATQERIVAVDALMKRERMLMQELQDRRSALLRAASRGSVP